MSPQNVAPLKVDVHLQDDPYACGRACAEMVVLFLTGTLYQQTQLVPPAPVPHWATSPDQLRDLINGTLPAGLPTYRVFSEASRADALDRVELALSHGYPAVTLSAVGLVPPYSDHWVVAHGITHGQPSTVHIRNPLPDRLDVLGVSPLPAHTTSDNCPAKDLVNSSKPNGEVAAVPSRYWIDKASDLPAGDPYKGRFVVVAPDFVAVGPPPPPPPPPPSPPPPPAGGFGVPIGQWAWGRLDATNLLTVPEWSSFGADPPLLESARSVEVANLDSPNEPFKVVRLTNAVGGIMLINLAVTGELTSAMLEPSDKLDASQFKSTAALRAALAIEPGAEVRAVWSHCRTTYYSPFVFVLEVTLHGHKYFVRPYDGKRFDKLI